MKLNWDQFINFWEQFYEDGRHPDKEFYDPYINDLSKDDFLEKLWHWKMGDPVFNYPNSKKVLLSMEKNKEAIRSFRKSNPNFDELYDFSKKFFNNGPVYQVFLMHICKPEEYPIFDQHVFRTFIFLTKGEIINTLINIEDYKIYKDFVFKINKQCKISLRDIDKGLMFFGQFLKNPKIKEYYKIKSCLQCSKFLKK